MKPMIYCYFPSLGDVLSYTSSVKKNQPSNMLVLVLGCLFFGRRKYNLQHVLSWMMYKTCLIQLTEGINGSTSTKWHLAIKCCLILSKVHNITSLRIHFCFVWMYVKIAIFPCRWRMSSAWGNEKSRENSENPFFPFGCLCRPHEETKNHEKKYRNPKP